jgi:hypothetical protein
MKTGAELIADERNRQVNEKGYDAKNDDAYDDGELSDVGAFLAINPDTTAEVSLPVWGSKLSDHVREKYAADPIRRLAIAGALIAAEIDRLQRAGAK